MSILIFVILSIVNINTEVPAWILATSGFIALAELSLWILLAIVHLIAFIIDKIGERNGR